MTNPDGSNPEKVTQSSPQPTAPPATVDLENGTAGGGGGGGGGGVMDIVRRWRREDFLKKSSLASRGFGLVFSLLAFIVMVSNKHGDWQDFDKYEEYRYLVAISILSTLYTGFQFSRQVYELQLGRQIFLWQNMAVVDFFGDQVVAYLLISAVSSAVPMTNRMREGADNIFTDASASAISMAFFAFFSMALSALISGYKLTSQSYI